MKKMAKICRKWLTIYRNMVHNMQQHGPQYAAKWLTICSKMTHNTQQNGSQYAAKWPTICSNMAHNMQQNDAQYAATSVRKYLACLTLLTTQWQGYPLSLFKHNALTLKHASPNFPEVTLGLSSERQTLVESWCLLQYVNCYMCIVPYVQCMPYFVLIHYASKPSEVSRVPL